MILETSKRREKIFDYVYKDIRNSLEDVCLIEIKGQIVQVTGTILRAVVPNIKIGELCTLKNKDGKVIEAEVTGFMEEVAVLSPLGGLKGVSNETYVSTKGQYPCVGVGENLLGRVMTSDASPADGKGEIIFEQYYPLNNTSPDPMKRMMIKTPLALGIKAIDGLLTMGRGQRLGIFAAAGVGKSKLISSIITGTEADVIVLALIGERGKEVREFIEDDIGEKKLQKSVVVFSTSDHPSMERVRGALLATTIAEYFRDQGKNVLLLIDSITRYARALREIGLSAGEPPARRGFPPSVFSELPKLLERAGNNEKGSISAIYTILVEGDDMTEPVADETRSILDGHIVLSRKLATEGHYPAIDVLDSVSRSMGDVVSEEHLKNANYVKKLVSKYRDVELLLRIGEYQEGNDEEIDIAVKKHKRIEAFLCQQLKKVFSFKETLEALRGIVNE